MSRGSTKNFRFGHHKGSHAKMADYCAHRWRTATTETMREVWLRLWRILVSVCGARSN